MKKTSHHVAAKQDPFKYSKYRQEQTFLMYLCTDSHQEPVSGQVATLYPHWFPLFFSMVEEFHGAQYQIGSSSLVM